MSRDLAHSRGKHWPSSPPPPAEKAASFPPPSFSPPGSRFFPPAAPPSPQPGEEGSARGKAAPISSRALRLSNCACPPVARLNPHWVARSERQADRAHAQRVLARACRRTRRALRGTSASGWTPRGGRVFHLSKGQINTRAGERRLGEREEELLFEEFCGIRWKTREPNGEPTPTPTPPFSSGLFSSSGNRKCAFASVRL